MIKLENKIVIEEDEREFEVVSHVIELLNKMRYGEINIKFNGGSDLLVTSTDSKKISFKLKK
ncbi:MAG: hypothetical protein ACOYN6_11455 [Ignavibacteria bacterium]